MSSLAKPLFELQHTLRDLRRRVADQEQDLRDSQEVIVDQCREIAELKGLLHRYEKMYGPRSRSA